MFLDLVQFGGALVAEEDSVSLARGKTCESHHKSARASERVACRDDVRVTQSDRRTKKEGATVLFTSLTPPHCHNIIGYICSCPSLLGASEGV